MSSHINKKNIQRAISFGDGLFETLYYENGFIYAFKNHYERLKIGSKILDLKLPKKAELLEKIKKSIHKSNLNQAAIKIVIYRKSTNTVGYKFGTKETEFQCYIREFERKNISKKPINLAICKHPLSFNPALSEIKHTNRLDQVIAKNELRKNYTDGIMLSQNGEMIETTSANLFLFKDNHFFTPCLKNQGVKGIMREITIEAMQEMKINCSISNFKPSFLKEVSHIFITSSTIGIQNVASVQGHFKKAKQDLKIMQSINKEVARLEKQTAIKVC